MQAQVRDRARALCEYCHTAEHWQYVPFTVDHIVPLAYDGLLLLGLMPIGRATITALALNRERMVGIRAADIAVGRHPPAGAPLESASPSS
jgi:hypothetical protein